ncbi:MAG: hypothetical protein ABI137_05730 [Antricoccus sp.]
MRDRDELQLADPHLTGVMAPLNGPRQAGEVAPPDDPRLVPVNCQAVAGVRQVGCLNEPRRRRGAVAVAMRDQMVGPASVVAVRVNS